MASAPLAGDDDGRRWPDISKCYSRKRKRKLAAADADDNPPTAAAPSDEASVVTISLAPRSKDEARELRVKLTAELAQVRSLIRRIESLQVGLAPTLEYSYSEHELALLIDGDDTEAVSVDVVAPDNIEERVPVPDYGVSDLRVTVRPQPIEIPEFSGGHGHGHEPVEIPEISGGHGHEQIEIPEISGGNAAPVTPALPRVVIVNSEAPRDRPPVCDAPITPPVLPRSSEAPPLRIAIVSQYSSSNGPLVTPVPDHRPQYEPLVTPVIPTQPTRIAIVSQYSQFSGSTDAPVTPVVPRSVHVSTEMGYGAPAIPRSEMGYGAPAIPRSAHVNSEMGYGAPSPGAYRQINGSQFSQYSGSNEAAFTQMPPRRYFASAETDGYYAPQVHAPPGRRLSVTVPDNSVEIFEKRTPKANQYYRNSDFILGSEKLPPSDSHRKSKSHGSRHGGHSVDRKLYAPAFRSCGALLAKLMKHTYGWVFNTPVDVKGLGLHDYYTIIRNPMDLGTVKSRLSKNWYKTPKEFAEDVRLTFNNAMTYNPKGQDVHFMAEQLLQIFEERWPSIEAEFAHLSYMPPPKKFLPVDMRTLERSDSTVHQMSVDSRPRPVNHAPHVSRPVALQKPKAKDLNKRNMTFEEKQKLSTNLSNLPGEKLDNIVQIIKKRNASLCDNDEIEVDIDSVDIETLWELDRFVTNYKKSLSKHRRRAELAALARAQNNMHGQVQERAPSYVLELVRENTTVADEKNVAPSMPVGRENNENNANRSSSSSSSSSDSGSSSSDSDSESSSGYGSETGRSPKT